MSEMGDVVATPVAVGAADLDGARVVGDLNELLRLRSTPVAMKRFRTVADMEAVP